MEEPGGLQSMGSGRVGHVSEAELMGDAPRRRRVMESRGEIQQNQTDDSLHYNRASF